MPCTWWSCSSCLLFKVGNVVAHRVGGKLVLGGFDPFGQRTISIPGLSQIRLWLWLAACSLDGSRQVLLCSVVRLKMHSQLACNSNICRLSVQPSSICAHYWSTFKIFLVPLQLEWLPCVKNWCGLNDHCAMDPIHPQHHWCLCRIGTDEHGNCVGEQCLIYSTTHWSMALLLLLLFVCSFCCENRGLKPPLIPFSKNLVNCLLINF